VTVVEVVPLVAGAAPIVIRRGIVGAVVGVLGLLVESAGLGVLDERLGVKVGCLLAVKSGAHLDCTTQNTKNWSVHARSVQNKMTPGPRSQIWQVNVFFCQAADNHSDCQ